VYGGGTVAGRLVAFSASNSGLVALRDADLDAREFDLEFAGRSSIRCPFARTAQRTHVATGRSQASPSRPMVVRDSLVAGWPETRIRGRAR